MEEEDGEGRVRRSAVIIDGGHTVMAEMRSFVSRGGRKREGDREIRGCTQADLAAGQGLYEGV